MTQFEAIQELNKGAKIQHDFFADNEFIQKDEEGQLIDETGLPLNEEMFWHYRNDRKWTHGWSIVE